MSVASPLAAPGTEPFGRLITHGRRVALVDGTRAVTYEELADRVEREREVLGDVRRLVLLEAEPTVGFVVAYLAALAGRHPVLLAPARNDAAVGRLLAGYDPDVVRRAGRGTTSRERRGGTVHQPHPDLALLLSTSGSTGSPRTVRLSLENIRSNATAIARSLRLDATDRAITSLPLHYCYGLSVLHSHLAVGACVALTGLSVSDERFWATVDRLGITSVAGVPHTFDLLDRVGFADRDLPSMRRVTQAGGALPPDRVRRYAELGRSRGWDFFVMYGQTEATARMAYLPPDLAVAHPHTVGVAVPGGAFRIEAVPGPREPGVGELVYTGPNVMLGYASGPADLRLGRTVEELRTGDLARITDAGLVQVVGRTSRFAKLFGTRVDLADVEADLASRGVRSCCTDAGDRLVLAVEQSSDVSVHDVRTQVASRLAIPGPSLVVREVPELPRLPNGKPDLRAVAAMADDPPSSRSGVGGALTDALVELYADQLGRRDASPASTFVGLGGDSLSYVAVSLTLEERLGHVPAGWPSRTIADLAAAVAPQRSSPGRGRHVECSIVLRAVAVVLVVAGHAKLGGLLGGAHVLLVVAGFNAARFQLDRAAPPGFSRWARAAARIAVPSTVFIGTAAALSFPYRARDVLLANGLLGRTSAGRYWFVETLLALLLGLAVVTSLPAARRWDRRWPFAVPVVAVLLALPTRYGVLWPVPPGARIYSAHVLAWLFALGWAAHRARTRAQRAVVTVLAAGTVTGFFDSLERDAVVLAAVVVLVWWPTVRVPAAVVRPLSVLAAASLFIYLVHWHVYPSVEQVSRLLAVVASVLAGVVAWTAWGRLCAATAWLAVRCRGDATAARTRGSSGQLG